VDYDTVTILPTTSVNRETHRLNSVALRSHASTCSAHLVVLDDRNDDPSYRRKLEQLTTKLGYTYVFVEEPFGLSKFWNLGRDEYAKGYEYICYATADVKFYSRWLTNLLDGWDEFRYESMHPYAKSDIHKGLNFRESGRAKYQVVECDHPMGHVNLFKADSEFRWDERYIRYEIDCDYWMWLKSKRKKAAVCYASRVDHFVGGIATGLGDILGYDSIVDSEQFKSKWIQPVTKLRRRKGFGTGRRFRK
jgi:hypothetical protein